MTTLPVNTKVSKNQMIAHTKNFSSNGMYASGKNVFMAMMNYNGFSHEDSYVISSNLANSMIRDIIKEVHIIVPPDAKILRLEKEINKNITSNDVLVEFTYQEDIEKYIEINDLEQFDDEEVLSTYAKGQDSIKLMGQNGEIIDIKIFINNKNLIDKQIVMFHNKLVKETKQTIGKLSSNITSKDEKYKSIDNLSLNFIQTGGHKIKGTEFLGARIVYYIKQRLPLIDGDKIAGRFGTKGVIGKVISEELTPYGEITPRIDTFISATGGIFG